MLRTCKRCCKDFKPIRQAQLYCRERCRNADSVARRRMRQRSGDTSPTLVLVERSGDTASAAASQAPTPTINGLFANQAELAAYQRGLLEPSCIELDANGYPELPECLDRRSILRLAKAA